MCMEWGGGGGGGGGNQAGEKAGRLVEEGQIMEDLEFQS